MLALVVLLKQPPAAQIYREGRSSEVVTVTVLSPGRSLITTASLCGSRENPSYHREKNLSKERYWLGNLCNFASTYAEVMGEIGRPALATCLDDVQKIARVVFAPALSEPLPSLLYDCRLAKFLARLVWCRSQADIYFAEGAVAFYCVSEALRAATAQQCVVQLVSWLVTVVVQSKCFKAGVSELLRGRDGEASAVSRSRSILMISSGVTARANRLPCRAQQCASAPNVARRIRRPVAQTVRRCRLSLLSNGRIARSIQWSHLLGGGGKKLLLGLEWCFTQQLWMSDVDVHNRIVVNTMVAVGALERSRQLRSTPLSDI